MAHVGGIGQIVGAIESREELVEEGGFVAGTTRCIEDGFVRIVEVIEVPGDSVKCRRPGDGMIMRVLAPFDHRTDETSLLPDPVIRLFAQLLEGISLEKFFGDDLGGSFMGDGFNAVFTKFGDGPHAIGIGPATARAIKSLFLIDVEKDSASAHEAHFMRGVLEGGEDGGDAPGLRGRLVNVQVAGIVDRDLPRRGGGGFRVFVLFVQVYPLIVSPGSLFVQDRDRSSCVDRVTSPPGSC